MQVQSRAQGVTVCVGVSMDIDASVSVFVRVRLCARALVVSIWQRYFRTPCDFLLFSSFRHVRFVSVVCGLSVLLYVVRAVSAHDVVVLSPSLLLLLLLLLLVVVVVVVVVLLPFAAVCCCYLLLLLRRDDGGAVPGHRSIISRGGDQASPYALPPIAPADRLGGCTVYVYGWMGECMAGRTCVCVCVYGGEGGD